MINRRIPRVSWQAIVVLGIIAFTSSCGIRNGGGSDPMDRLTARSHFEQLLLQRLDEANLTLSAALESRQSAFVADGVEQLYSTKFTEDQWASAESNLDSFADILISYAQREGVSEISETMFEIALQGICPLWPFC